MQGLYRCSRKSEMFWIATYSFAFNSNMTGSLNLKNGLFQVGFLRAKFAGEIKQIFGGLAKCISPILSKIQGNETSFAIKCKRIMTTATRSPCVKGLARLVSWAYVF